VESDGRRGGLVLGWSLVRKPGDFMGSDGRGLEQFTLQIRATKDKENCDAAVNLRTAIESAS